MTHEESGAQFAAAQHLKTVELQAIPIKAKDDEIARLGIVVADQRATIAGMAAPAATSLHAAAEEVLKHRHGTLPTCGWLRDNDASRKALEGLASAVAAPAAPSEQARPTVKQLAAQLDDDKPWTRAEQDAFAVFLARFPSESSQGIMSLGDAWKAGRQFEAAAAPAAPLPGQPEQKQPLPFPVYRMPYSTDVADLSTTGYMPVEGASALQAEPAGQQESMSTRLSAITAELAFLGEWLTMASEPIGVQCCGRAIGPECCGNPEPDYVHPEEVLNTMNERHAALTKELFAVDQTSSAACGGCSPSSPVAPAAPLPELTGQSAFLADLQAIDIAMDHMGDTLNEMDVVDDVDEAIAAPGFAAIAKLLLAAASPSPAPAPTDTEALEMLTRVLRYIDPRAVDAELARTGPMEDAYINTIARKCVERLLAKAETAPAPTEAQQTLPHEQAPPNSLPNWGECALRVENSDFTAKRMAEGGYGAEADSKLATQLHRFIFEYDDADSFQSAWFMHRLELTIEEAKRMGGITSKESAETAAPGASQPMEILSDVEVMKLRDVGATWMSQDGRDALDDWLNGVQSPPVGRGEHGG